jgi:hypothetical protein
MRSSILEPVMLIAVAQAHPGSPDLWATVIVIVALLGMPVLSVWFLWRGEDGPDDSGPDGGGGGGGGPPRDTPPPPDGPAWWPEFEREFAAYVAAVGSRPRARARGPVR